MWSSQKSLPDLFLTHRKLSFSQWSLSLTSYFNSSILNLQKTITFKLESVNNKNKWMGLQNDQSTAVFFKCLKWLAHCQGTMCACQPMRKAWIPYYRCYLGARFMCPGRKPASDRKFPSVLKVCMKLSWWLCSPAGAHWALTPAVSRSTSPMLPQLWLSNSVTDDLEERLGF